MKRGPTAQARAGFALLLLLGALSAFGPLATDLYLPALPTIGRDLHASEWLVQLSLTACLAGFASGQLLAGPASDKFGRRPVLVVGLLGFIAGSVLCAVAPTAGVLALLRFFQGAAGSFSVVISQAVIRDLYSGADMSRTLSRLMLINMLAPMFGPVVGAELLRLGSWRLLFAFLTGIGLVMLVFTLLVLPETLVSQERSASGFGVAQFRRMSSDRTFVLHATVAALLFGAMFAYFSASSFVIQVDYGASAQTYSLIFGIVMFGELIVSQVSAHLVSRTPMRSLLRLAVGSGMCASGAVLVVATFGRPLGLVVFAAFLSLAMLPIAMAAPNATALALEGYGRNAGAASALLGAMGFTAGAVTSPIVGAWGRSTAVPMAVVMTVMYAMAFLVLATLGRSRPRADRDSGLRDVGCLTP